MYKKVFISHSRLDPRVDFFHKIFSGLETKAIWAEYEDIYDFKWDRSPWEKIREQVNASDAVFVLLSHPLLNLVHTNNWVSFEIGLAANSRKLLQPRNLAGLDVYVFEPIDEQIDFPVPYCTYYMLYNTTTDHLDFLKRLITAEPEPSEPFGEPYFCPHTLACGIGFYFLTAMDPPVCPACRKTMDTPAPTGV